MGIAPRTANQVLLNPPLADRAGLGLLNPERVICDDAAPQPPELKANSNFEDTAQDEIGDVTGDTGPPAC